MYFGLMILARLKYIKLADLCIEVEVTLEMLRRYKYEVLIKLQQNLIQAGGG